MSKKIDWIIGNIEVKSIDEITPILTELRIKICISNYQLADFLNRALEDADMDEINQHLDGFKIGYDD